MNKGKVLISVYNKEGVRDLAQGLKDLGYCLVSTGGTARHLEEAGLQAEKVEELTGFPEVLGGRVKTLHPKIHAGILARDLSEDWLQLQQLQIDPIDLVIVNLYPFEETVAKPDVTMMEALEQIDIGGVTLIRAAAKNFPRVAVVVNPGHYEIVLRELQETGKISQETRFNLAAEAFRHTAAYDVAIANYLQEVSPLSEGQPEIKAVPEKQKFPQRILLSLVKQQDLRYGENPHQEAAFYREEKGKEEGLPGCRQLQGKELSFNNLLDLEAAWRMAAAFEETAAVVIKHNTPSGVACDLNPVMAFKKAFQADALAAYGGIAGLNRAVDLETAKSLTENFLEAVIAPAYNKEALEIFKKKPNLRILSSDELFNVAAHLAGREYKQVSGGFLLQDRDFAESDLEKFQAESRVITKKKPFAEEWEDLIFAWVVAKHVFSNAIVVARGKETLGIGGGQVSRVAAARLALEKAGDRARGAVLASDGFLPFADTVELAAASGIAAIIQPGGSIRDDQVIAAADAAGIAMVFTGKRHFRH